MQNAQDDRQGVKIITMYAPIFREKLDRLERRGQGLCREAVKLREALARVDRQTGRSVQAYERPSVAAG